MASNPLASFQNMRRLIWSAGLVLTAVALLLPIVIPAPVADTSLRAYNAVEGVPNNSIVLIACDNQNGYPPFFTDTPGMIAQFKHMVRKHLRIVVVSFATPVGIQQMLGYADSVLKKAGYEYGKDYVNLGYFPGSETAMAAFSRDIHALARADSYGKPLEQLPLMREVKTAADFKIGFDYSSTVFLQEGFVRQIAIPYKLPTVLQTTGMGTDVITYYPHTVVGMILGIRGCADYERLIGEVGTGVARLTALHAINCVMVGSCVMGNTLYFMQRKGKGRK